MKQSLVCLIFGSLFLFAVQPSHAASRIIPAKAYILLTDDESVLYEKNASEKLPPASTVKLMTAMVALDRLAPETKVIVSAYVAGDPLQPPPSADRR